MIMSLRRRACRRRGELRSEEWVGLRELILNVRPARTTRNEAKFLFRDIRFGALRMPPVRALYITPRPSATWAGSRHSRKSGVYQQHWKSCKIDFPPP